MNKRKGLKSKGLIFTLSVCLGSILGCTYVAAQLAMTAIDSAGESLFASIGFDKHAAYLFRVQGDFLKPQSLVYLRNTVLDLVEAEYFSVVEGQIEDVSQIDPTKVQRFYIQREEEKYKIEMLAKGEYTKILVVRYYKDERKAQEMEKQAHSMATFLIIKLQQKGFKILT